ncbi:hypothetical protein P9112_014013 [Eukaryota sp. TZLM1-RC]
MNEDSINISSPVPRPYDKYNILPSFLQTKGVARHHIDSFDFFVNHDIHKIVSANSRVTCDSDPYWFLDLLQIRIGTPSVEENMLSQSITPQKCRLRELTYSAPLYVDVRYCLGKKIVSKSNVFIGKIPVMLRSSLCVLRNKTEAELAQLGECPLDPGGYFIVKGTEKVVLIQEQLSKNRIIIEEGTKNVDLQATITSSTHERKTRTNVVLAKSSVYLKHNSLTEDIPLFIVFKAMGVETDMEIVQLVAGKDQSLRGLLASSLQETVSLGIISSDQALLYIGSRIKQTTRVGAARENKVEEGREILLNVVFSHIPVENFNLRPKCMFLAITTRRLLLASKDSSYIDDKDYYGNKRIELAGDLISLLFEDCFKKFLFDLKKQADNAFSKTSRAAEFDILAHFKTDTITYAFTHTIASGNWVLKRFKMDRAGVTAVVSRLSYMGALGHMTRISSQFEKSRKVSGPRALQLSQWGVVCPTDTPEGESCGLVKNLALLCHVTNDTSVESTVATCFSLGVSDADLVSGEEIHSSYLVFIDGQIIGIHDDPLFLATSLRKFRRRGLLSPFMSVYVHSKHKSVYVACDGGRLCRPLLVVSKGKLLMTNQMIDDLGRGTKTFDSLIQEGIVEYIDVNEHNDCFIALNEDELTINTTHCEIHPMTILGVVAGLIPFPDHNQSPRNTYQCAMGKQAIGAVAYNQFNRVDTVLYLLVYPQKPMVRTKQIRLLDYEKLPAGQNAMVAVMSYSGYDIEDALILNKASIDRGYGRCFVYKKEVVSLRKYANGTADSIVGPPPDTCKSDVKTKRFAALDLDGIASPGQTLSNGDVYLNKVIPTSTDIVSRAESNQVQVKSAPMSFRGPADVIVDRSILSINDHDELVVKFSFRETRIPEIGDKFSSRHGQKGVTGLIVSQDDMPFTQDGVCPDMIMNPHGFPSRMTVGKMIELIGGKAGICEGKHADATVFDGDSVEDIGATLVKHGYSFSGKDLLTCGITGQTLSAYIFFGPIYYQKLKHMVLDKMHARARGPKAMLTRQPTEGRSRDGGLRLGEMERDVLIAYGTSMLMQERLMISSDEFVANVCGQCGIVGYSGWCQHCRTGQHVTEMKIPYASKLLLQELQAMNIAARLEVTPVTR